MFRLQTALLFIVAPFLFAFSVFANEAEVKSNTTVDFSYLLSRMYDLNALARLPDHPHKIVQFSSYDRRSVSPDKENWYSNSDGFGNEPIPGVLKSLGAPDKDGVGLYLLAEADGPGAIVRSWSASMGGVIDVYLDNARKPIYSGPASDFLVRRSQIFLSQAGVDIQCGDAFRQQDADYMPIPFKKSLRVIWTGKINSTHFYHLEVQLYDKKVKVKTFDPIKDLVDSKDLMLKAVEKLTDPSCDLKEEPFVVDAAIEPKATWKWETPSKEKSGAISNFAIELPSGVSISDACRGVLLRIAFDGAHEAQVEAPLGDFFGTGPGIHPFNSLPMSMTENRIMTCRFIMPFCKKAEISLLNTTNDTVKLKASITVAPWSWDDRSLHFRAKWRTINNVNPKAGPFDVPYIFARGQGRFVGAATMIANPTTVPHPYGSWWGEGDEKIFVDDESFPSFFGTGSEDYYNYSWSRPDLFDHPYCGQPLDSGPGNGGYCSNHRWHINDSIPFMKNFAFYMELWPHNPKEGLCYSSIAYLYARPGAIDDHRRIQASELIIPIIPSMAPLSEYGSRNSVFFHFEEMDLTVEGGDTSFTKGQPCESRGRLFSWSAKEKDRLKTDITIIKAGDFSINLTAAHWLESGAVRILLDNQPLIVDNLGGASLGKIGEQKLVLKSPYARRLLSTRFKPMKLSAGEHELVIECLAPGLFGMDYIWIQKR